jgi:hypothetical protein
MVPTSVASWPTPETRFLNCKLRGRARQAARNATPLARTADSASPAVIDPQLATLVDRAPAEGGGSYDLKFDG